MEELLPYYERELVYLHTAGRELAHQYPRLAAELGLGAEGSEDPHIRRLIQACALLNARTAKKLDDDYPELTEALRSPNASPRSLGDILDRDAGLAAGLLKLVNSSFFGLARRVSSTEQAVTLLGERWR